MSFDIPAPQPYTVQPIKRSNQRHRIITDANGTNWYLNKYGVVTGAPVPDVLPGWQVATFPKWSDGLAIRDHVRATDPNYREDR